VVEENGCVGIDSILILVESITFQFEVPNVFSPNGDEENPNFLLINLSGQEQVSRFELVILNRWGQMVRSFDTPDFVWDGKDTAGNLLSEGVYFYKIVYQLQDNSEDTLHGFVHLLR
jgi:gliding motility-associated-like protein